MLPRLCSVLCLPLVLLAGCSVTNNGKYFENDGPPAVGGEFKAIMSDEVTLKVEQPHKWANRRYKVMGKYYTPVTGDQPMVQTGTASWYGKQFHGKKTAIGETYDMYAMTAAHPTMELPSFAKVTNLSNGRSVIVRVNDRGPFLGGRIIDMSYAAAVKLGYHKQGTAKVRVERITRAQIAKGNVPTASDTANRILAVATDLSKRTTSTGVTESSDKTGTKAIQTAIATQAVQLVDPLADLIAQSERSVPETIGEVVTQQAELQARAKLRELQEAIQDVPGAEQNLERLKQAQNIVPNVIESSLPSGWTIQIGSYSSEVNAREAAAHAEMMLSEIGQKLPVRVHHDNGRYRVLIGDEGQVEAARALAKTISQLLGIQAFCTQL